MSFWLEKLIGLKRKGIYAFLLLLVLIFALYLRALSASYGMPEGPIDDKEYVVIQPNEDFMTGTAIEMVKDGRLNPQLHHYGPLTFYLEAALLYVIGVLGKFVGYVREFSDIPASALYYWIRILHSCIGLAVLLVVYLIAVEFPASKTSGLCGAALLSVSFLHWQQSTGPNPDLPATFWVLLATYFAILNYVRGPQRRYYIFSALSCACAVATKANHLLVILPLATVHALQVVEKKVPLFSKDFILACLLVPAICLVLVPWIYLDADNFFESYKKAYEVYTTSRSYKYHENGMFRPYCDFLWLHMGPIPMLMGLAGALFLVIQTRSKSIVLLIYPVLYYLFMGRYTVGDFKQMTVVESFIGLFAGCAVGLPLDAVFKRRKRDRATLAVVCPVALAVFCLFVYSMYVYGGQTIRSSLRKASPSTLWQARVWFDEHIPFGADVARDFYAPPLDERRYRVTSLGFRGFMKEWLDFDSFEFMVTTPKHYNVIFAQAERFPKMVEKYKLLQDKYEVVAEFSPNEKVPNGPLIRIYRGPYARNLIKKLPPAIDRLALENPGFEQWRDGLPVGWKPLRWAGADTVFPVPNVSPDGGLALGWGKVHQYGIIEQRLPIDASVAGKSIVVAVNVMSGIEYANLQVGVGDIRGVPHWKRPSNPHPGDNSWHILSTTLKMPDTLQKEPYVVVYLLRAQKDDAIVYFDNVTLRLVTE